MATKNVLTERYPGPLPDGTPGKAINIRFDQKIADESNSLREKRAFLEVQLRQVNGRLNEFQTSMGKLVCEGDDLHALAAELSILRAERELMQAGVDYLSNKIHLMQVHNTWLK